MLSQGASVHIHPHPSSCLPSPSTDHLCEERDGQLHPSLLQGLQNKAAGGGEEGGQTDVRPLSSGGWGRGEEVGSSVDGV